MEDTDMYYDESSAFRALVSSVSALPQNSAQEADALLENLKSFFDSLNPAVTEAQITRTEQLLTVLSDTYAFSSGQLADTAAWLKLLFTNERTQEVCGEAASLLKKVLNPDGTEPEGGAITALCIKALFPAVYDISRVRPVEPKLLFMQPRRGLNESFRYIYRKLELNYPYQLTLYEFHRDTVSTAEYYVNASFFMRDMATAKAVFVHESNNLMGYLHIRPETRIIQLWHGCGVFKHIGLSTAGKDGFKSLEKYLEFPEYNNYSIVTIASPELTWVFEEFMGIPKETGIIQPYGVCRTDEFFDHGYVDRCFRKLYKAIPAAKSKKVILYAPTYRGVDPNRVSPDALDIEQFAKELGDDYILIMKHHQTVKVLPEIPESCRDSFAYDMTRGKGMNINELMTIADVCITDYSSVAFEFSLFERPLLFFVYDLDEYIDNRGLYYNFDEITPGPLCRTTEEMIDYIKGLKKGFDSTEVTDFKNRFMCSCDGHACERTIAFLGLNRVNVYYNGNGATGGQYASEKNPDSSRSDTDHSSDAELEKLKNGALRLRCTVSLPVTEYTPVSNPFLKDAYEFSGWQMYQLDNGLKYWLCEDGAWHTDDERNASGIQRRTLHDQETICPLSPKNGYAIYLDAQWTPNVTLSTLPAYIRSLNLKQRCKNVIKKMIGRS